MAIGDLFNNVNIFGAGLPAGSSGLLTEDEQKKLANQSLVQGLLGTAASYLAQPKTGRYGSALPYLGKAYLGGMQASQDAYTNALNRAYQVKALQGKDQQLYNVDGALVDREGNVIYQSQKPTKLSNEADRLASSMFGKNYGGTVAFNQLTNEEQQQVDQALIDRQVDLVRKEKYAEFEAKSKSAYLDKIDESGDTAYDRIQDLNQLEALLSNVDAGGMGEETYTQFQSLLSTFGLGKDELVGNKQASIAISNRLAKALRKPGEGVMTDADFRVLKDSVPGLSQTPQGRVFLINSIRKLSEREMQIQDMAYKYLETNPILDNNFKRQLLEFRKANPLFTQEELQRMQGSKQITRQPGTTSGAGTTVPSSKSFQSTDELIGLPKMNEDGYYDIP